MPSISNPKVVFASIPDGMPIPGKDLVYDTSEQIDLDTVEIPSSGLLVKLLSISLDPYLRGKMNKPNPKNYTSAFHPGETIYNFSVAEVLRSNDKTYPVGSNLYGIFKAQSYLVIAGPPAGATVGDVGQFKILDNSEGLDWTSWTGAAGMPGKTAFYGMRALSKAKKGESIFVSSAYGAVGALVCQIAKSEYGLKVIASAGSEEKVKYLREELGVDVAFNYKTEDTAEQLEAFGGIDIFWDGVGGSTLDAALGALKFGGRAIECGMISGYNNASKGSEFKNIMKVIGSGLTITGFLVFQYEKEYQEEFYKVFPAKLASGEYKFREHILNGLEGIPQGFVDMLAGKNEGKVVVRVA